MSTGLKSVNIHFSLLEPTVCLNSMSDVKIHIYSNCYLTTKWKGVSSTKETTVVLDYLKLLYIHR